MCLAARTTLHTTVRTHIETLRIVIIALNRESWINNVADCDAIVKLLTYCHSIA